MPSVLNTLLYQNLVKVYSKDMALAITSSWAGAPTLDRLPNLALPMTVLKNGFSKPFFVELCEAYIKDSKVLDILPSISNDVWVTKRDDIGFWTLLNATTGAKRYICFEDMTYIPIESTYPECVNILLSSNGKGKELPEIYKAIDLLTQAEQVLELNLIDSPYYFKDLGALVTYSLSKGVSIRVTRTDTRWITQPVTPLAEQVLQKCIHLYFKVTTAKQAAKVVKTLTNLDISVAKFTFTYSLDDLNFNEFLEICKFSKSLGIKVIIKNVIATEGFEAIKDAASVVGDSVIEIDANCISYRSLVFMGLSKYVSLINRGKFSCFFNAVDNNMGLSEYEHRLAMAPFNENWADTYKYFIN